LQIRKNILLSQGINSNKLLNKISHPNDMQQFEYTNSRKIPEEPNFKNSTISYIDLKRERERERGDKDNSTRLGQKPKH